MASGPPKNRAVNDSDRLINVWGFCSPENGVPEPEEFFEELCWLIGDGYNPGTVLLIGTKEDTDEFKVAVKEAGGNAEKLLWVASKHEEDFGERPFCFASKANTDWLLNGLQRRIKIEIANSDEPFDARNVKAVVQLYQEEHERFLPYFLQHCPADLKVFCIPSDFPDNISGRSHAAGMEPRTDLPGYDAIPASVNLDAAAAKHSTDDSRLTAIPDTAIYGRLQDVIDRANAPRGYSYIAALVAASVFVEGQCNIRATLYGGLIGGVHTGKTVASDRVRALLGLPDESPLCVRTPYSDRGVFQVCKSEGAGLNKRLLPIDEGRIMFSKGNIQNSTLMSLFCSLWSRNTEGGADKKGLETIKVELSILANLKVKDASEFPEIFTHATAHGLYDRFLFGVRGDEKWHYTPWDFDATQDVIKLDLTKPNVSGDIFKKAHDWSASGKDRDRLKEIALRVAYITSAANNDLEVSSKSLNAALCLMEWQESIRQMFQPAEGADEWEQCYNAIELAFQKAPGHAANFRELSRNKSWNKRYGRVLKSMKKGLEDDGTIVLNKKTGLHYWNKEEKK